MNEIGTYKTIPAMTPTVVHDYLRAVGRKWSGQGAVAELGCWLGATTVPLLEGLKAAGYNRPYYAFDRWECNEQQFLIGNSYGYKFRLHQDLMPVFAANVKPLNMRIHLYKGNLPVTLAGLPKNEPIEVCLFDAPKKDPVFSVCADLLVPHFIPGVTVWGLLDYNFWIKKEGALREQLRAPVRWMERHQHNFKQLAEWPTDCTCVFFKYIKKI